MVLDVEYRKRDMLRSHVILLTELTPPFSAAANAAAAYQTGQTGYPVAHTPTPTYTAQRAPASTYDTGTYCKPAAPHSYVK